MRYTPASHYNLAFSIRQARVPLGGVLQAWPSRC